MVRILQDTYPTVDDLFEYLDGLGYTGNINDKMKAYLIAQGETGGSLADMLASFIAANGGGGGGDTPGVINSLSYFKYGLGTQATVLSGQTDLINFDTPIIGTLTLSGGIFTVPSTLNNAFGNFVAGMKTATVNNRSLLIQKSTNGGGVWSPIAAVQKPQGQVSCGAIDKLVTNTQYRVAVFNGVATSAVVQTTSETFFSMVAVK